MTIPIALFLTDFGRPQMPDALPGLPSLPDEIMLPEPAMSEEELELKLEEARRQGFEEGESSGLAALEARVAELEAAHQKQIAEARRKWAVEYGASFAVQLHDGFSALEERIAGALAEALQPVLGEAIRSKALAEAKDTIATLLNGGDCRSIRISGPADLVEALQASNGTSPILSFEPAEQAELTIAAGDTTIRSNLQVWAQQVQDQIREER